VFIILKLPYEQLFMEFRRSNPFLQQFYESLNNSERDFLGMVEEFL
jgi:hypothetical protein